MTTKKPAAKAAAKARAATTADVDIAQAVLAAEFRQIDSLIPYARNARTHDEKQIAQIAASIVEFGFTNPVLADAQGIVAGHGRVLGATKVYASGQVIKLPNGVAIPVGTVPVLDCTGWSEAKRKAYILADNQIALNAGWDEDLLRVELEELQGFGFDMDLTGFNEAELAEFLAPKPTWGETDPDEEIATPAVPVSRAGDVWVLGRHRIICGDSTDRATVERVLAGARPNLMVTDPPYGVEYDANWRNERIRASIRAIGKVENDDRADWSEAWALFDGDVAYVWCASLNSHTVIESLIGSGFEHRSQIIWAKQQFAIGRSDYHWQHEPCQPAGTMVARVAKEGRWREHSEIEQVPIEQLRVGDRVVSFGNAKIYRRGREITRIGSRQYEGNMHTVRVGDSATKATAEHQFTVRLNPEKPKAGVLYLMRRGNRWRIGVCGLFNSRGFGLAVRLAQECGDEAWIISAHPDLRAARIAEQVASCVYGIPTTHWETGRNAHLPNMRSLDEIDQIYRRIGVAQIEAGAHRLLASNGLLPDHPLITAGEAGRFSRRQSRIIRACNLIPGIMQLPLPTEGEDFEWRDITAAEFEPVSGVEVWSMDVDQDQHYVADGIVTHNCWYAVRKGAKGDWRGGRKQTTVWQIPHQKSETGHSTQKPVECMKRPIENNSLPGAAIYEPFSGSGTTIIACEMTGRSCHAIELSPAYVDVAVTRWERFTGAAAVLEGDGRAFAEVMAERCPPGQMAVKVKDAPKPSKAKPPKADKAGKGAAGPGAT